MQELMWNERAPRETAAALGNFDGVHLGHAALLRRTAEAARSRGLMSLAYTFDRHPENAMAGAVVTPMLTDRAEKAARIAEEGVDCICFAHFTPELAALSPGDFVRQVLRDQLRARVCVCGFHYHFGAGGAGDAHMLASLCAAEGIETVVLPPVTVDGIVVSSSLIRSLIASGQIERAERLCGHPFVVRGEVLDGKHLGRTIGLPTINQRMPEDGVVPRYGVYESRTVVGGAEYRSISNVGMRPTVAGESLNCETHIIGYEGDLYGESVPVRFVRFLRPERKFPSVEAMREQIESDIERMGGRQRAGCGNQTK